ncbi:hypothetical protein QAD02_017748 [Eretmocerus hayati]|uniref:Uncharacterized protein n=1 Tax=Eretmocerus hayati TaxID=131215 RepID=A0ACC2PGL4_9HYME|nr:hypothetical protein QAD02_017748 [Eretmocerus hayati]
MIRCYTVLLFWMGAVIGKEGYFWHISDIHYDPRYSFHSNGRCWSDNSDLSHTRMKDKISKAGIYGNYNCDPPWLLVESAAKAMKANHGDDIEFVLWTGELRLHYLENLTRLMSHTFTDQFVFPVLGHEDMNLNLSQIANLWRNWLPDEALVTLRKHGYYTIEQRSKKYQIISLNTNLWMDPNFLLENREANHRAILGNVASGVAGVVAAATAESDPSNQWQWFSSVLDTARRKGKVVYIAGHTPPGVDDRETGGVMGLSEEHNARYLQLVQQYSDIIRGQFFGHWHSDTFRIVYNDLDKPVSWIMATPSITPYRSGGPNNPGLRLYKFESDTGQVLDYAQYYLDLARANSDKRANWQLEYNLREHYSLTEITPSSLNDLADRFTRPRDNAFARYYEANRVKVNR